MIPNIHRFLWFQVDVTWTSAGTEVETAMRACKLMYVEKLDMADVHKTT